MKIAGYASQRVFQHFYTEFRKSQQDLSGTELVIDNAMLNELRSKKQLTSWELKVRNKLFRGNIEFETKFRIFPIKTDDGKEQIYIPDFTLKNYRKENKIILIEASEDLNQNDIPMFSTFIQYYGNLYHLIMIVTDNQLRLWNTANATLFHEIWTIDDLDYLIQELKRNRVSAADMTQKQKITNERADKSDVAAADNNYVCIGCHRAFSPSDVSQIYCKGCLSKIH